MPVLESLFKERLVTLLSPFGLERTESFQAERASEGSLDRFKVDARTVKAKEQGVFISYRTKVVRFVWVLSQSASRQGAARSESPVGSRVDSVDTWR